MKEFDLVIEPGTTSTNLVKELWRFRELFFFMAWRDVLVRYKQTVLGASWAILRPLLTTLAFTFAFGTVAGLPSGEFPYVVLVSAAMLPWQLFSTGLTEISGSLIGSANVIKKVYFPRLIIPTTALIVAVLDMFFAFAILLGFMLFYKIVPDIRILALPAFVLLSLVLTLGLGVFISALTVRFRDFKYVTPFVVQMVLFCSPIGFSTAAVPEEWRTLYSLNPMVGIIDGYRWSLLRGTTALDFTAVGFSIFISCALLWSGLFYFKKTERNFADII